MRSVLVFFERIGEVLTGAQQELLTLASSLGRVQVVTGESGARVLKALSVKGVDAVYAGDGEISPPDPALVDLLETAVAETEADVVLGSDTADATDALARLAVRRDTGLITDAVGISTRDEPSEGAQGANELVVSKSVLAGSYTTTAQLTAGTSLVVTVKPNAVEAAITEGAEPELSVLPVKPSSSGVQVLERNELEASERPPLTEARVVVAGGRGVDGDFGPLEELADELGGAIGASRAATDAGWIEHSAQIGQTGVTVSPQLYISAGISGAIQQRAGMQTAQTIVAINKDEDAPVFEIADFGVVGDLFEVIPQVVEELRRRKG